MPERGFRFYLLLGFVAGTITLVLLGVYAVVSFYQVQTRLGQEQKKADTLLLTISRIESSYSKQNLAWANILIHGQNPEKYHSYLSAFYQSERETLVKAEQLHTLVASETRLYAQSEAFLLQLYKLKKDYRQALQIYNSTSDSPYSTEEFLSVVTLEPSTTLQEINSGVRQYYTGILTTLQDSTHRNEAIVILMTIAILTGLVISLLRFVDKYFAKPMAHSIATAKLVAQGDLDRRIELFARGEFGEFARTFNRMLDRLQHSNVELESTVAKLEEEVDERVRVEQELHSESRALASAIKELESFSYSVSHDLRAPLRSIAGFSRILQEDYSEALDNEARGYLARVQNAATRMGKIIDDLLELSRVNRRPLSLGRVNLSEMALQVIEELAEAEPDRNVEVNISEGMVATTDASLARIVLANLLGNAWKYTRGKAGARIDFEPVTANGETIFRIRDNGAGFSMEYVDKLFRPFQRLHTDVEFEGTGIGLAIVERIILRQGGTIKAKAERGMGASFSFRFAVD